MRREKKDGWMPAATAYLAGMRRIAVVSDIHGNLGALERVLGAAATDGCEPLVWCLGDTFSGLGGAACFRLLLDHADLLLAGNHEAAVLGVDPIENYAEYPAAVTTIQVAQQELVRHPELQSYLEALHTMAVIRTPGGDLVAVHASPAHPIWHFVSSPRAAYEACSRAPEAQLIVCGHTHAPALSVVPRNPKRQVVHTQARKTLDQGVVLGDPELQVIVNPGSVGMDTRGVARWGVLTLDDDLMPVRFDWRAETL